MNVRLKTTASQECGAERFRTVQITDTPLRSVSVICTVMSLSAFIDVWEGNFIL
jgi:hypothetical protein